jgi:4-hydroxy-tetrahydrodipicolinate synthase
MLQDWDFRGYSLPVPLIARLFGQVRTAAEGGGAAGVRSKVLRPRGACVSGGWAVMQMIEALTGACTP